MEKERLIQIINIITIKHLFLFMYFFSCLLFKALFLVYVLFILFIFVFYCQRNHARTSHPHANLTQCNSILSLMSCTSDILDIILLYIPCIPMNLCYTCVLYECILCMYQCILYACKQNKFPEIDNKIELN